MSHERNLEYLNKHRIVYRRMPISDKPTELPHDTLFSSFYDYYENGTYECYELFRSRAKITTNIVIIRRIILATNLNLIFILNI